jgi:glycosyltransferase involved in cell wall biosynthesis
MPNQTARSSERVRILRIIARLNIGGPAYHVTLLSGLLAPNRYETLLVSGHVGAGEGSYAELAHRYGAHLYMIPHLGPEIRPLSDLRAFIDIVRLIRRFRPHIVHTHTAKAGVLGRTAALSLRPRPLILHTYHGHVLEGFFGPWRTRVFRLIERACASISDCLIGVSEATVTDLVKLGISERTNFRVIPLGLDLERLLALNGTEGQPLRQELGIGRQEILLAFSGRLVPTKRVDLMLRAFAQVRHDGSPVRLVIAGDGRLRGELEALADELGVKDAVHFLGFRKDVEVILAAADLAFLTSDSEGTPLFLIEAAAAGLPAVATEASGGVQEVVLPGTGVLVRSGDVRGLADAVRRLVDDARLREEMGKHARRHARSRFSSGRLLQDVDSLYSDLLAMASQRTKGERYAPVSTAGQGNK